MHTLLIDIGNTSTKLAMCEGRQSGYDIVTIPTNEADVDHILSQFVGDLSISRAAISSVVPAVFDELTDWLTSRGVDAFALSAESILPFKMGYRTPETLGADRIAGAAGAVQYARAASSDPVNVVSVDAGTAVTFDFVSRDNVFLGGPIAAGPDLIRRALSSDTAQLSDVQLYMPDSIISGSSEDAIRAGIMIGFVDGALGILRRIVDQADGPTVVIFSGGWGRLLADEWGPDAIYRPTNMMDGLLSLLELN